ncbi:MAG: YecA family protein [Acidobacteriota bacterium]
MPAPGRNDPCPCGSGLKYKKCCMGKDQTRPSAAPRDDAARGWAFTLRERESAIDKLMRFAHRDEFREDWQSAFAIFAGSGLVTAPEEQVLEAMESDMAQINFTSWVLYDLNLEEGLSIADLFLQRRKHDLSPGERAYIEKALAAHFRLYEILEVLPDEGFTLKDLTSGESISAHEKMGTRFLAQWGLAAMRLMDYGGYVCIDAGIIPFPREDRTALLKELEAQRKRIAAPSEAVFFKRVVPLLNHWWLQRTLNRPLPKIVTAEGDPLLFTKVHFDVADTEALRRTLDAADDLDHEEGDTWGWSQPHPEDGRCDLGRLVLKAHRLTLEVTSKERGERGREYLERLAGNVLTHRATLSSTGPVLGSSVPGSHPWSVA